MRIFCGLTATCLTMIADYDSNMIYMMAMIASSGNHGHHINHIGIIVKNHSPQSILIRMIRTIRVPILLRAAEPLKIKTPILIRYFPLIQKYFTVKNLPRLSFANFLRFLPELMNKPASYVQTCSFHLYCQLF